MVCPLIINVGVTFVEAHLCNGFFGQIWRWNCMYSVNVTEVDSEGVLQRN